MPLILLAGLPCAAKTRRATQLRDYFELNRPALSGVVLKVHLVNDESLRINRDVYKDPAAEKMARGAFMSAVERLLAKDTIVIADGMNYIKGFRYQLYCVARAISTPHCVIYCGIPADVARSFNDQRQDTNKYDSATFDNLVSRFEEPDARTRWDAPLFTVFHTDELLPFDAIVEAVILRKAPPPNMSTVAKPVSAANYLHEFDQTTQDIVNAIIETQKSGAVMSGAQVIVPRAKTKICMPAHNVTLVELKRLRRQFSNINKQLTIADMDRVAELFVSYLTDNLNT